MTFPDFEDYCKTKEKAYADYEDKKAWAKKMLVNIDVYKRQVEHILAQDPRAAYNKARDYIYGMRYGKFEIRFVADSHAGTIEIADVVECIDGYHKLK